ncbi:MAG TPA: alanine dehydrogenase [Casimicrobiaceae bacterium]|jgi:alanine dehydrogenase
MRIGVPRERKDGERRVAVTPDGVAVLTRAGHDVVVERGAGERCGFSDASYVAAGATLAADVAAVYGCRLMVKVKELQREEIGLMEPSTTVFGFAQLGRDPALLEGVLASRIGIIGYETVGDGRGHLPLLAPMSRIAGRLAPLIAASLLMNDHGGAGVLLPGVDAVAPGRVVIVGAGNVGSEAARVALALGTTVTVFARTLTRQAALRASCDATAASRLRTALGDPASLAAAIADADVLIGAVLVPGRLSPKLVSRPMLRAMRAGSVFIDVGIDQGGIGETSRMTSISAPTFVDEGIVHYGVPNMPALVARTATLALSQVTLPRVRLLADLGVAGALRADADLRAGLQVWDGAIVHPALAADAGVPVTPWE